MKKLLFVAMIAGSMIAVAADAAKVEAPAVPAKPAAQAKFNRPKLTEEQIKERREKMMAEMKARRAEMEAKMLETIKKYVPEEEKAKALLADLQKQMMPMRRPMPRRGAPAPKAAPAK